MMLKASAPAAKKSSIDWPGSRYTFWNPNSFCRGAPGTCEREGTGRREGKKVVHGSILHNERTMCNAGVMLSKTIQKKELC